MKINVDITTDPVIRKQIREVIENEVKSLTKKYFHKVIEETVKDYLFRMTQKNKGWEDKKNNPFIYAIEQALKHQLKVGWNGKLQVNKHVNKYLADHIEEWFPNIDIQELKMDVEKYVKKELLNKLG